jgi:aspartate/glutamate racemase
MGPRATEYFVGELLGAIEADHRPTCDQDYPDVDARFACSMPDRSANLADDRLRGMLENGVRALVRGGCSHVVIPCVTAHAVLGARMAALENVLDVCAHAMRVCGGLQGKVAVICTDGTARGKPFGDSAGLVYVDGESGDAVMRAIYDELKGRGDWRAAHRTLSRIFTELREAGAERVLAGCSEVEMCFARCAPPPRELVMPLREAAWALSAAFGAWKAAAGRGADGPGSDLRTDGVAISASVS